MGNRIKVGLIYGGKSGEHEVSLQTALAVMKEFDYTAYEIKPIYITKTGEWRSAGLLTAPPTALEQLRLERRLQDAGSPAFLFGQPKSDVEEASDTKEVQIAAHQDQDDGSVDVVFPLLHGTFGEDGTVQGLLEVANIPYVGAGVLASSVGMDKILMKKVFAQEGLPQCVYRHFNRTQWEKDAAFFVMECEVALGYPCFIKPANLGSSVGITKANNREELMAGVNYALRFDRKVIVEEFVDAREIEVGVLGNDEPKASVVGEISSSGDFYDYKAKYLDGKSSMYIPANLPAETAEAVREMAIRAFQAIDGSGLSRVDFFLRKDDGQIFINEINTLPGFTPFSMYPLLWKESGIAYRDLLAELITLALERHEAKQHIDYTGEALPAN